MFAGLSLATATVGLADADLNWTTLAPGTTPAQPGPAVTIKVSPVVWLAAFKVWAPVGGVTVKPPPTGVAKLTVITVEVAASDGAALTVMVWDVLAPVAVLQDTAGVPTA
jgi:hypothetical protein